MPHLNVNVDLFNYEENNISSEGKFKIQQAIWDDVKNNANKQGINLDFFYGSTKQCFCLIVINNEETVQKVMNRIKRREISNKTSSSLLSTNGDCEINNKIEWVIDVYAMEVTESVLDSVCNNVRNQPKINLMNAFEDNNHHLIQYHFEEL
jgi:hypothetical protein